MTRTEHVAWCKQRALEYVERGDMSSALASMGSDLEKHPDTANHPGMTIGMGLLMMGELNDPQAMKRFIEGFN